MKLFLIVVVILVLTGYSMSQTQITLYAGTYAGGPYGNPVTTLDCKVGVDTYFYINIGTKPAAFNGLIVDWGLGAETDCTLVATKLKFSQYDYSDNWIRKAGKITCPGPTRTITTFTMDLSGPNAGSYIKKLFTTITVSLILKKVNLKLDGVNVAALSLYSGDTTPVSLVMDIEEPGTLTYTPTGLPTGTTFTPSPFEFVKTVTGNGILTFDIKVQTTATVGTIAAGDWTIQKTGPDQEFFENLASFPITILAPKKNVVITTTTTSGSVTNGITVAKDSKGTSLTFTIDQAAAVSFTPTGLPTGTTFTPSAVTFTPTEPTTNVVVMVKSTAAAGTIAAGDWTIVASDQTTYNSPASFDITIIQPIVMTNLDGSDLTIPLPIETGGSIEIKFSVPTKQSLSVTWPSLPGLTFSPSPLVFTDETSVIGTISAAGDVSTIQDSDYTFTKTGTDGYAPPIPFSINIIMKQIRFSKVDDSPLDTNPLIIPSGGSVEVKLYLSTGPGTIDLIWPTNLPDLTFSPSPVVFTAASSVIATISAKKTSALIDATTWAFKFGANGATEYELPSSFDIAIGEPITINKVKQWMNNTAIDNPLAVPVGKSVKVKITVKTAGTFNLVWPTTGVPGLTFAPSPVVFTAALKFVIATITDTTNADASIPATWAFTKTGIDAPRYILPKPFDITITTIPITITKIDDSALDNPVKIPAGSSVEVKFTVKNAGTFDLLWPTNLVGLTFSPSPVVFTDAKSSVIATITDTSGAAASIQPYIWSFAKTGTDQAIYDLPTPFGITITTMPIIITKVDDSALDSQLSIAKGESVVLKFTVPIAGTFDLIWPKDVTCISFQPAKQIAFTSSGANFMTGTISATCSPREIAANDFTFTLSGNDSSKYIAPVSFPISIKDTKITPTVTTTDGVSVYFNNGLSVTSKGKIIEFTIEKSADIVFTPTGAAGVTFTPPTATFSKLGKIQTIQIIVKATAKASTITASTWSIPISGTDVADFNSPPSFDIKIVDLVPITITKVNSSSALDNPLSMASGESVKVRFAVTTAGTFNVVWPTEGMSGLTFSPSPVSFTAATMHIDATITAPTTLLNGVSIANWAFTITGIDQEKYDLPAPFNVTIKNVLNAPIATEPEDKLSKDAVIVGAVALSLASLGCCSALLLALLALRKKNKAKQLAANIPKE